MAKLITTLIVIHDQSRVLLGMKKRGFGAGRWNGFGGKVEEGETIEDAARRELAEEAGVTVGDMGKVGIVEFRFRGKEIVRELHVFAAASWVGEPTETEEMRPQWFALDQVPYDTMWSSDRAWLPLALAGKKFRGAYVYDENDQVLEQVLHEVESLE